MGIHKPEEIDIEVLDKVHAFGVDNYGKTPNWLYLNREHYMQLLASGYGISTDFRGGRPETIFGMQFIVDRERKKIEVQ